MSNKIKSPSNQAAKGGRSKKNEYMYIGGNIPAIDSEQHADFILNYQKSILLALVERNLLTPAQCERCVEALTYRCRLMQTAARERGFC